MEDNIRMTMAKKQKLELTWIGKDDEVKLEPRVLIDYTIGSNF